MARPLAEQVAAVRAELASRPARLLAHTGRVVAEARDLCRYWDIDPGRAELAAWGHDLFRAHEPAALLRLAQQAGLAVLPEDEASPVMLHGPLAAVVLRERIGVDDEEALAAVHAHTTGGPAMPLLAKVILLADKFEPRKRARAPLMKRVRQLARRDLDLALLCWADWKWVEERGQGWDAHPVHWQARLDWVQAHHAEAALPGREEWAEEG